MGEWVKVLYGLVLSLALGFLAGWGICRLVILVCSRDGPKEDQRLLPGGTDLWLPPP